MVMIDMVKTSLDVTFDDPSAAAFMAEFIKQVYHCILAASLWSESVAYGKKVIFDYRFYGNSDDFLRGVIARRKTSEAPWSHTGDTR